MPGHGCAGWGWPGSCRPGRAPCLPGDAAGVHRTPPEQRGAGQVGVRREPLLQGGERQVRAASAAAVRCCGMCRPPAAAGFRPGTAICGRPGRPGIAGHRPRRDWPCGPVPAAAAAPRLASAPGRGPCKPGPGWLTRLLPARRGPRGRDHQRPCHLQRGYDLPMITASGTPDCPASRRPAAARRGRGEADH